MAYSADEARRLAVDPTTDAATLYLLAQEHKEVLPLLAGNPATYPELLTWLQGLGIAEVDEAIARRSATPNTEAVPAPEEDVPTQVHLPAVDEPSPEEDTPTQISSPADQDGEETAVVETEGLAGPAGAAGAAAGAAAMWPEAAPPARESIIRRPQGGGTSPAGAGGTAATGTPAHQQDPAPQQSGAAPYQPSPAPYQPSGNAYQQGPAPYQQSPAPYQAGPGPGGPRYAPPGAAGPGAGGPPYAPPGATGPGPSYGYSPGMPPTDWSPQPQQREEKRRGIPLWARIGAAVGAVLLVGAVIWALMSGSGDETPPVAVPTETAPTTAEPTPTPTPEITDPATEEPAENELEAEFLALQQEVVTAAGETQCSDIAEDSEGMIRLAHLAGQLDEAAISQADATTRLALLTMQQRCNAGWTIQVAESAALSAPEIESLTARDWVIATSPAPGNARRDVEFHAPSRNIACVLSGPNATCSIYEYNFTPEGGACSAGAPVTVVVDEDGAHLDCSVEVPILGDALNYGTTSADDRFYCTSQENGMHCFDSYTGAGFHVARADLALHEQILGWQNSG